MLPAMYIEEETELAFDDITPEDPDFSAIQGMDNWTSYMLQLQRLKVSLSSACGVEVLINSISL